MKRYKEFFIPVIFLLLSFSIILPIYDFAKSLKQTHFLSLEDFEGGTYITLISPLPEGFEGIEDRSLSPPFNSFIELYPDCTFPEIEDELDYVAKNYGLTFGEEGREYIENYVVRTMKSPFPHYDKYKPVFYNIPVNGHKIVPDLVDKEHKVAIVFQRYKMYHLDDIASQEKKGRKPVYITVGEPQITEEGKIWSVIDDTSKTEFYDIEEEILDESTVRKENQYFQNLIEQADSSMKVKKPFQNEDTYTVIYIERGFCQWLYYDSEIFHKYGRYEGALTPYLEKAFESLGYTKIDEKNN